MIQSMTGTDGQIHFAGGFPITVFRDTAALTLVNGAVLINIRQLREAVKDGNPGVLAVTLRHEAQHFDDLRTRGFSSKELDEYRAYENDVADAAYFNLKPSRISKLRRLAAANKAAMDRNELTSFSRHKTKKRSWHPASMTSRRRKPLSNKSTRT